MILFVNMQRYFLLSYLNRFVQHYLVFGLRELVQLLIEDQVLLSYFNYIIFNYFQIIGLPVALLITAFPEGVT